MATNRSESSPPASVQGSWKDHTFALVYVFLWEGITTTFLGGVRYLSVRGYTLALLHGIDAEAFETLGSRAIEFPAALVGSGLVTYLFFWLTVRRLRRMDVA